MEQLVNKIDPHDHGAMDVNEFALRQMASKVSDGLVDQTIPLIEVHAHVIAFRDDLVDHVHFDSAASIRAGQPKDVRHLAALGAPSNEVHLQPGDELLDQWSNARHLLGILLQRLDLPFNNHVEGS